MRDKPNGASQDDFVGAGFHQLDENLVQPNAPKISWGKVYLGKPVAWKLTYLERLASTMNHAAFLIKVERDQLNELCIAKETQIVTMKMALDQNNRMIQDQITKMNTERQKYNAAIAELNADLSELKNDSLN